MSYDPPFTITPAIVTLIEQIGEALGRLSVKTSQDLRLRRVNRIQTLHGSLAIEGNTLSEDQIATILDGKEVVAPIRDVQEVRNAIKAYDQYPGWNPASESDLLKAHEIMMLGLIDVPGQYRISGAGVMGPQEIIHVAPQADRVPELMSRLLAWLDSTKEHALLKSCVFHYEFEFIHPFVDGNGRLGRLWQTLILTRWNELFANIPVESMVYAHQQEYYDAIAHSSKEGQSTVFIEFMLNMVAEKIQGTGGGTPQDTPQDTPQVRKLLSILKSTALMSRQEILEKLELSDRKSMTQRYLRPALDAGFIEMTIPDKPSSKIQQYRITPKGKDLIEKYES
ncbi:MAG: Fic family protein [Planctomycetota bacterium]|jgi:Fic family protein/predicted transcriptional regulator